MIRPVTENDYRRIGSIDRESAKELRFHADVIPETALVSEFGKQLAGVGYVLRGQGRFLHLAVRVNPRLPKSVGAAEELFRALTGWFYGYRKQAEKQKAGLPVLRLWCRETETAYRAFAESFGFVPGDRMKVMERTLSPEDAGQCPDPAVRPVPLQDPASMENYIRLTEEAYGMPDRAEEMRFRLTKGRGRVYGYCPAGEPVSFVTVWPKEAGVDATENVFTVKAAQRKGYAKALLNAVAKMRSAEGTERLRLTVYCSDEPAIRLYEKIGYRTVYELEEYWLS